MGYYPGSPKIFNFALKIIKIEKKNSLTTPKKIEYYIN